MSQTESTKAYMWMIIAAGAAGAVYALWRLPVAALDARFWVLAVATVGLGPRVTIQLPNFRSHVAISDTFIFLTLLLFGGEAAILLATIEAFCSAWLFCNFKFTVVFNAAVMSCSTGLVVLALHSTFGDVVALTKGSSAGTFYVALCLMALVQFASNSGLASIYGALRSRQPLWQTWKTHYLWTSLTYVAGAAAAGVLARLVQVVGFNVVIATTPIIGVIYMTYRVYLKNLDISLRQASQAEKHAAELRAQAGALAASEERFRSSFDYAPIGIALVSPEGRWLKVNRSLCEIIGYTEEELLAADFQSLTHPDDLGGALIRLDDLCRERAQACQSELRYLHRDGRVVWVLWSASAVRAEGAKDLHLIFQIQDITDRQRAEHQLRHDALHDALTGLPNRARFVQRLALAIERARRDESYRFALLFLDLDRFKYINDSLGHLVGDQLLVGLARRLEPCLRQNDTLARLGGDEFTILIEEMREPDEAARVAERVRAELARPFVLDGHEVFTSASIGIAAGSAHYERAEDVLRDADTAMYQAKRAGKARHEIFDQAMHEAAKDTLTLETDLRHALERNELRLLYQPIVRLNGGRIIGFEALLRWEHPRRGLLSPSAFIDLAEETGLIVPVGNWALHEACRQARVWHEQFPDEAPLSISVNLSGRQFAQPGMVDLIKRTLHETRLPAASLTLEITESVAMDDAEGAAALLRQLQDLGVQLSIDDFGTGYSSLSYLHRLPVSTLKIDRSFVSRLSTHKENNAVVRTIITLARGLGLTVVAEGVETYAQANQLRALDCDAGQGFLFAQPLVSQDATDYLIAAYDFTPLSPASFDYLQPLSDTLM